MGAPPEPAQGGRLLLFVRAAEVEFAGRLLLPKPCGARPESVLLPCALQAREEVFECAAGFTEPDVREPCCIAEGGRLAESCDWRLALNPGEAPILGDALFVVRTAR